MHGFMFVVCRGPVSALNADATRRARVTTHLWPSGLVFLLWGSVWRLVGLGSGSCRLNWPFLRWDF